MFRAVWAYQLNVEYAGGEPADMQHTGSQTLFMLI